MKKRLMMLLGCFFLFLGSAIAQTNVSGIVTSSDDGEPVVGAAVRVEGTNTSPMWMATSSSMPPPGRSSLSATWA